MGNKEALGYLLVEWDKLPEYSKEIKNKRKNYTVLKDKFRDKLVSVLEEYIPKANKKIKEI